MFSNIFDFSILIFAGIIKAIYASEIFLDALRVKVTLVSGLTNKYNQLFTLVIIHIHHTLDVEYFYIVINEISTQTIYS